MSAAREPQEGAGTVRFSRNAFRFVRAGAHEAGFRFGGKFCCTRGSALLFLLLQTLIPGRMRLLMDFFQTPKRHVGVNLRRIESCMTQIRLQRT